VLETAEPEVIESAVLKLYAKLNGYSQQESRLSYLDYVRSWKIYGSAYVATYDYIPYVQHPATTDDASNLTTSPCTQFSFFEYSSFVLKLVGREASMVVCVAKIAKLDCSFVR
jgi:hypothetical protein